MRYQYVQGAKAERYDTAGGESSVFLATAIETAGRVSIFDSKLNKGSGAPLHYHETDDEIFYIISGEVQFDVNDDTFIAKPGDLIIAGPGVRRKFTALADSHMLGVNAPAGPSEGFLRDVGSLNGVITDADKARFIQNYGIHVLE